MNNHIKLTEEEIKISNEIYNKKIEHLIKLGEIKLSEINNEKKTEESYFNLTEINTRETQFLNELNKKYGPGTVDISTHQYIQK